MARKSAARKPTPPPQQPLPASTPAASSGIVANVLSGCSRHGRSALLLSLIYILFRWVLPALAEMTPPGIDPKLVAAAALEKAQGAAQGCTDTCRGMTCPAGWTTGRDKENTCKCICVRVDPSKLTPWDEE